ncbi:hypothetical protein HHS_03440 [Candidatus Pantoea carbekii]|uniref:Z-ring associated protein G n=1 Tax=Candidatus Pantoea carbekii TaxID=1235990 RepID=U3U7Q1_9GAMM|nr:hypothetical protein HHS_03440 [Candidatus Pantoea carbekii]
MTWQYSLIGLIIGIIIGVILMRFSNKKLRKLRVIKDELEQSRQELLSYREALVKHFSHSAELADNMIREYRKFYQHMKKSCNELLPNLPEDKKFFAHQLPEMNNNNQTTIQIPRDYSEHSSSLTCSEHTQHN